MLDRNGDYHRAQVARLTRATLHLHAMDFAGVRALCASAVPLVGDALPRAASQAPRPYPPTLRWALILSGQAEAALGNHQRALEYLSAARLDMDRSESGGDWYRRISLQAGFTEVALATGKLPRARVAAQQFLEATLSTAEHTWQALAWEANARVAKAEHNLNRANECIAKALATTEGFEVPAAAWRTHATAAEIAADCGDLQSARSHREISRATILQLANSLPTQASLRQTFLSAASVSRILNADSVTESNSSLPASRSR